MDRETNPVEQLIQEAYPVYGVWKEMADEIGYVCAAWAQKQLHDAIHQDDIEYPDNERYCRVGNAAEEAAFDAIARDGCCGVAEWEAVDPEGRRWRFGFNYGH